MEKLTEIYMALPLSAVLLRNKPYAPRSLRDFLTARPIK
jgi:hypothetical protein